MIKMKFKYGIFLLILFSFANSLFAQKFELTADKTTVKQNERFKVFLLMVEIDHHLKVTDLQVLKISVFLVGQINHPVCPLLMVVFLQLLRIPTL
jgi:hypothetical protein